jgi:endonuclease/exonuclease/phosphatase family metal-dependent hydrolase
MTFNLRFENSSDGPNAWQYRRELVTDLIEKYGPSILGTQEGMCSQLDYINNNLSEYSLHAPHRTLDATCQYPTLFFHKDGFRVHEVGEFWLSKTPKVHLSKSWDSAFPRMMSYARVSEVNDDKEFWVVVTHLDHMGAEARYQQARIIKDWLRTKNNPVILMGDFNDSPGSPVHHLLTSSETGLQDTWKILNNEEEHKDNFTHHAFTGIPQKSRMDWILVSQHFHVIEVDIIKDNTENRYPSDHFPYLVKLDLDA